MYIKRDYYLQKLIRRKENGMVKVIAGLRRSGKSFLLFNLYHDYLVSSGIKEDQIIPIALDDRQYSEYRDVSKLDAFIRSKLRDSDRMHYIFIDEVQYAIKREELKNTVTTELYDMLNGLLRLKNTDIYVTGSNSKMLTSDVLTAFRGRSDKVEIWPLSFKEFYGFVGGDKEDAYEQYALFGGLPGTLYYSEQEDKISYLKSLFDEIYFKDIVERYNIELPDVLEQVTDELCSSVGSLTNASSLAHALSSARRSKMNANTVSTYLGYLVESFLFRCAKRYDVKGKRYFSYPSKYYCADPGLRNVRLNLRQQEESHIMENIIYNELASRGYAVDVGVVTVDDRSEDKKVKRSNLEIDFIINKGMKKYYIQSALRMDDPDKKSQEQRPLLAVKDSFRKIVITKTRMEPWVNDQGVIHIGLYDFLLDETVMDL
jgi:predicted AAA+ superfamily ATPase